MKEKIFAIRIGLLKKASSDTSVRNTLIRFLNDGRYDLTILDLGKDGRIIATQPCLPGEPELLGEYFPPEKREKLIAEMLRSDSHLYYSAREAIEEISSIASPL